MTSKRKEMLKKIEAMTDEELEKALSTDSELSREIDIALDELAIRIKDQDEES